MDPTTFDRISKLFAARRHALAGGGASLGAAALGAPVAAHPVPAPPAVPAATGRFAVLAEPAPGATAVAPPTTGGAKPTSFLFLQSFEAGSLVPKAGSPGRYTLTLRQGLGDTVY